MTTVPHVIRGVGNECQGVIEDGAQEIILPADIKEVIGLHGIREVAQQYCMINGKPGTVVYHNGKYVVHETDDDTPTAATSVVEKTKKASVARPPNAFILYRQMHHTQVKEDNPGMHNNEISSILGKQWRNESEPVKQMFYKLAQDIKDQHALMNPGYIYRPRKSADKKRRMSRKKAIKLSQIMALANYNNTMEIGDFDAEMQLNHAKQVDSVIPPSDKPYTALKLGGGDLEGSVLAHALIRYDASVNSGNPDEADIHSGGSQQQLPGTVAASTHNAVESFHLDMLANPRVHSSSLRVTPAVRQVLSYETDGVPIVKQNLDDTELVSSEAWREFMNLNSS